MKSCIKFKLLKTKATICIRTQSTPRKMTDKNYRRLSQGHQWPRRITNLERIY